ncbi:pre-mrna branch site p14 [Pyrenophora seminiperda CCB06]|uniref:Pre-mrna branch site p14 n=1 Tax=Pyrenophora seminiperda CCB06 TaxID=1302712 RepID=A0A3M7M4C8_9PLEO|nr:pre-mrna branch site p14 [Pyrenophora seminiperda CCB06]
MPHVHRRHVHVPPSPPRRPSISNPSSPSSTVHHSRQSMSRGGKLAPEVNRALFVKNLSFNVTPEELFDLFGKFGPVRQIRQGIANNTKGTAFVVYEDPDKMLKAASDLAERQENLEKLKQQHGID